MSLLLALTGGIGPPTVDCSIIASQVQTSALVSSLSLGSSASCAQSQSTVLTALRGIDGVMSASQAQSVSIASALAVACSILVSQVQSSALTMTVTVDGLMVSSQVQGASAVMDLAIIFNIGSWQVQSATIVGIGMEMDVTASSEQVQSAQLDTTPPPPISSWEDYIMRTHRQGRR